MSIKISNLKNIEEHYKKYLETYFATNSKNYADALNEYNNSENGLVGFSGENTVVKFSVVMNPENNTFIFEQKDKYNENQIKNYKDAKEEVLRFIKNLQENINARTCSIKDNPYLSKSDKNIISLIESIEKTNDFAEFENDLISLDFQNIKKYKIDKDNPIISTEKLFSTFEVVQEVSLNDLKNIFSEMIERNEKVNRFNQSILETASSIYTDVTVEEERNISNKQDFGFSPRPNF